MTKDEYVDWWSDGKGLPEDWEVVPCDCGREDCPKWRVRGPGERLALKEFQTVFRGGLVSRSLPIR